MTYYLRSGLFGWRRETGDRRLGSGPPPGLVAFDSRIIDMAIPWSKKRNPYLQYCGNDLNYKINSFPTRGEIWRNSNLLR